MGFILAFEANAYPNIKNIPYNLTFLIPKFSCPLYNEYTNM